MECLFKTNNNNNKVIHIKCNNQSESQSQLRLETRDGKEKALSHQEDWVKLEHQTVKLLSITTFMQ